jgi:hypothetical protein
MRVSIPQAASIPQGDSAMASIKLFPQLGQGKFRFPLPTLAEVYRSPNEFLGKLDIGLLNLICAGGLRGAENLDIAWLLDWIDAAAEAVDYNTRRHWYRFLESPGEYRNSPGYFCCYYLLQTLQEDFGVRYNPAKITDRSVKPAHLPEFDSTDSRDLFIHGIINGPGGTCASMPVLYVAVGRRLGYPLKLVGCRGHLFFRWDDPTGEHRGVPDRFNIEGTGYGISCYPDSHYESWPEPLTEVDRANGWYLKSLTPTEEFAKFLAMRGDCLGDNGRTAEAIQAFEWACGLMPGDLRYQGEVAKYTRRAYESLLLAEEVKHAQREAIEHAKRNPIPGSKTLGPAIPLHNDVCRCFHCKQARQLSAAQRGAPGHPTGCFCFHCERAKQTTNHGVDGHSPHCGCYRCNQARGNPFGPTNPFQR